MGGFDFCILIFHHDEAIVACHDLKSRHATVVLLILEGFRVGFAHDGDEHIEEGDLNEESSQDEKDVAELDIDVTVAYLFSLELTQSQLILVLEDIQHPIVAESAANDLVRVVVVFEFLHSTAHVENEEGRSEKHVADEHDPDERRNAINRLADQTDKEGEIFEQTKPVEQLDPNEEG